ncbi:MAG: OmpA family protein [Nitrospinae bacterium]|nr:OmpA family protein [Nitrospinota bacterium]
MAEAEKVVPIPCPQCKTKTRVPLSQITAQGLMYACPQCKTQISATRTDKGVSVRRATAQEVSAREENGDGQEAPPDKTIIIKGAPTWTVTFADLATLLLTFFVLMLSFANMDIMRFKELMGSVQERFGVTTLERGQFQAVSKGSLSDVDSNLKDPAAAARERLVNIIADSVIRQGFHGAASISSSEEGVRVRIQGRALFDEGSAALHPASQMFLQDLSGVVKSNGDLYVVVEGHTDDQPVSSRKFPSNWELSVLRAASVLKRLAADGAPANRMAAAGYADTRPLFPNNREETRALNRRVEFLFKRG